MSKKQKSERIEALIRIPLAILYWIVMYGVGIIVAVTIVLQFLITIITGKRNKTLSKLMNNIIMYMYTNIRYLFFTTNKRPFPFEDFKKPFEKVE